MALTMFAIYLLFSIYIFATCARSKFVQIRDPLFRPVQVFFKQLLRGLLSLHCLLKVREQCRSFKTPAIFMVDKRKIYEEKLDAQNM